MLDGPLDVTGEIVFVDKIHPQRNEFVTGEKISATGDSKLNHSPAEAVIIFVSTKNLDSVNVLNVWIVLVFDCQPIRLA